MEESLELCRSLLVPTVIRFLGGLCHKPNLNTLRKLRTITTITWVQELIALTSFRFLLLRLTNRVHLNRDVTVLVLNVDKVKRSGNSSKVL